MRFNSLRSVWLISVADTMLLENAIAIGIAAECLGCLLPYSLSGAVHVERQQNGDEELLRPPLLVSDLVAVAKLVMSSRQAWAHPPPSPQGTPKNQQLQLPEVTAVAGTAASPRGCHPVESVIPWNPCSGESVIPRRGKKVPKTPLGAKNGLIP
jgi:hypothetical protein